MKNRTAAQITSLDCNVTTPPHGGSAGLYFSQKARSDTEQ